MNRLYLSVVVGLAVVGAAQTCRGAQGAAEPAALRKTQAPVPVIWDDFSDGKISTRTGKDPWGRPLPEWKALKGKWTGSSGEARVEAGTISIPCRVTNGTWKVRYRPAAGFVSTGRSMLSFVFIKQSNGSSLNLHDPDGHWWLDYGAVAEVGGRWPRVPQSYPYINMVGSQISKNRVWSPAWHDVTFIRDDLGYVGTWLDGKFVEYSQDRNLDITDNTAFSLGDSLIELDNIEVYDGVFLIPNAGVTRDKDTITVNDHDVDLPQIAKAVNDPAAFKYDPATRTAVCNANILVKSGAKLKIVKRTLKMAGGRKILFERAAKIFLDGATLTSADAEPWHWELKDTKTAYAQMLLSAVNSHIDNCDGFSVTSIKTLFLKDSRFTNLVGDKPISILFRRPPNGELLISGCLFQGKTGNEAIFLKGGDQFHQLKPEPHGLDIIDTVFDRIKLISAYDEPYYLSPGRPGCSINLTNSKVPSMECVGEKSVFRFKYYLDVKVVDGKGNPVPGATVSVTNEQNDANYPSENLERKWKYLKVGDQVSAGGEKFFAGQTGNWFKGLVDANNHPSAVTGADGHTPPPSDAAGTLVLTESSRREEKARKTINYTYKIAASKNGKAATMTGLDIDESWYRPDPNKPAKTVVCNLDAGTCQVEVVGAKR